MLQILATYWRPLGALVLALVVFIAGARWQTDRDAVVLAARDKAHAATLQEIQLANAAAQRAADAKALQQIAEARERAAKAYAAQQRSEKDAQEYRDSVRDGVVRLSVRTTGCTPAVPAPGSTGGVAAAGARAELAREDAADLVAIADAGDAAIRQCNALIREISARAASARK